MSTILKIAQLDDFLELMPKKYSTRGSFLKLSIVALCIGGVHRRYVEVCIDRYMLDMAPYQVRAMLYVGIVLLRKEMWIVAFSYFTLMRQSMLFRCYEYISSNKCVNI